MTYGLIGIARVVGLRAGQAVMVAVVVGVASFAMMQALPGDAAFRIAAGRYGYDIMDAEAADAVRHELGLDRPVLVQLGNWLGQLASLDLGYSQVTGHPISEEIAHQLGVSLELALWAVVLSVLIALPLGVLAGVNPGGRFDRWTLSLSIMMRCVPGFALGILLILILAVEMRLFPVAGHGEPNHLVLPAVTLALGLAAVSNRVIRDAVVVCLASSWYGFARTKGLWPAAALSRHVLRNAAVPAVAYVGVQLAYLIEGVVVIEAVFALPGIGHALVHAIFERDVPMVQGTALTLGLMFVFLSLIVDLTCQALDPRRASGQAS